MNSTNILWIIVAVAVICLLSWLFYSAKGDAVRLLSMIVLAIIFVISLFYLSFAAFYLVTDWNGDISKEIRSVGTFTLGLPIAALGSLALVIVLPAATNQSLKVEGAGFKIEGPTIQIILWVLCFLTIVGSIKLLQPGSQPGAAEKETTSSTSK